LPLKILGTASFLLENKKLKEINGLTVTVSRYVVTSSMPQTLNEFWTWLRDHYEY